MEDKIVQAFKCMLNKKENYLHATPNSFVIMPPEKDYYLGHIDIREMGSEKWWSRKKRKAVFLEVCNRLDTTSFKVFTYREDILDWVLTTIDVQLKIQKEIEEKSLDSLLC